MSHIDTIPNQLRKLADVLDTVNLEDFYGFTFWMQTNEDPSFKPVRNALQATHPETERLETHERQVLETLPPDGRQQLRIRVTCMENPRGYTQEHVALLREELAKAEAQLEKLGA